MRLTTIPDYNSSLSLPFLFKLLIGGIRNIKNKYFKNGKDTWDEQYKNNYSLKMDCADQQPRNLTIAGIILENFRPGLKILDVGCGNGTLYNYLATLDIDYLGIDISEIAVKEAQERFSQNGRARFAAADFEKISQAKNFNEKKFDSEKFDIIIFNEVLYYFTFDKIQPVINKAFSMLKNSESIIVISMSFHLKSNNVWKILKSLGNPFVDVEIKSHYSGSRWNLKVYGKKI